MSRIGKMPIALDSDISAKINDGIINISGPRGALKMPISSDVNVEIQSDKIVLSPLSDTARSRAMWGTTRSIINNMVVGVKQGFKVELELVGVGYRAAVKDNFINLNIGKGHSVRLVIPEGIKAASPKPTQILMEGFDKELIGQFAATIVKQRPPEPYKGKGIRFKGQIINRKEGKKK